MRSDWDPSTTCRGCHAIEDVAQHGGHSPACTQCDVDQSRAWAAAAWPRIGLGAAQDIKASDPTEAWAPRVVLDLHGGEQLEARRDAAAIWIGE